MSYTDEYKSAVTTFTDNLDEDARKQLVIFALHYMESGDSDSAAEIAGMEKSKAWSCVNHPYVQLFIKARLQLVNLDDIMSINEIYFQLKVAAFNGSPASKLAALRELSRIRGLVSNGNMSEDLRPGVIPIPHIRSMKTWEKLARNSQKMLKHVTDLELAQTKKEAG